MTLVKKLMGVNRAHHTLKMAIVLFQGTDAPSPLQPVALLLQDTPPTKEDDVLVISHFGGMGVSPRSAHAVRYTNLIEIESRRIFDDNIEEVDRFDFTSRNNIIASLKDYGVRRFIINDLKGIELFISHINSLGKGYKYSANTYNAMGISSPASNGDELAAAISIYALPYALPIFNSQKVDGFGIQFTLFWKNATMDDAGRSRPYYVWELFSVVNNYRENLLVVDGQKLRQCEHICHLEYLKHYLGFLKEYRKSKPQAKKKC